MDAAALSDDSAVSNILARGVGAEAASHHASAATRAAFSSGPAGEQCYGAGRAGSCAKRYGNYSAWHAALK